jgi:hypothetical protein
MFGSLTRRSARSGKALGIGVLVAVLGAGVVACARYRSWRYPCVSRDPGLRGEVMRSADGKDLYFNGECWTARPTPPTDTPLSIR